MEAAGGVKKNGGPSEPPFDAHGRRSRMLRGQDEMRAERAIAPFLRAATPFTGAASIRGIGKAGFSELPFASRM
jgi:hypothetical protein